MALSSLSSGPIQDSLFGTLAARYHFVLEEQVQEALRIQQQMQTSGEPVPRLGEILVSRGYITATQVQAVLKGQIANVPKLFGELAIALQLCPRTEVAAALGVQKQIRACGSDQRLGEVLVARGALRPHQVHAVLREQGKAIVTCPNCKTRLNVSSVSPGSAVNCPRCSTVFRTPSASTSGFNDPPAEEVRADISGTMPAAGQAVPSGGISRLMNAVVGKYQLGPKLGADSSGVLYKAFAPQMGIHVALRMLNPSMLGGRGARENWVAASEAACELAHPNLQRILEIGSDEGRIFLAMEYVEGESLRQAMAKRGKFPVLETLDTLLQMGEALAYGHAHGFLHGDLRPAHVIIGFDGIVRVSGLGTPKNVSQNLRQVAQQLGEEALPLYTPPEVIIDEHQADERSDLYSLGAIGYHLLTGRPPHEGVNVLQLGLKMASERLRAPRDIEPTIAPYVNRLICKCLEAEPDDRYDTMPALLEDLRKTRQALVAVVADVPEIGAPARLAGQARTAVRRATEKGAAPVGRKPRLRTHIGRSPHGTGRHRPVPARPKSSANTRSPRPSGGHAIAAPRPPSAADGIPALPPAVPTDPLTGLPLQEDADALVRELGDELENEVAEQAAPKKPKRQGKPMSPGVSTKAVLIGTAVVIVLVVGLVVAMSRTAPVAPAEAPKPKAEAAAPLIAAAAPHPEASQEWRLLQSYIKENPADNLGIVKRLEVFKLKFSDIAREQTQEALTLLKKYSEAGVKVSLPDLRAAVQKLLDSDRYADADKEVNRWKEQWRWDTETAQTAKSLLDENAARQKQTAESRMNDALRLRKDKKWDDAYAIYKGLIENFAPEYATAARRAKGDAVAEADASLSIAERENRAKQAAEAKAARETAAPARLTQLAADMEAALKTFDLEACKRALEGASSQLSETPQEGELQMWKDDYKKLLDLRDRIVRGSKTSKYSLPRVSYRDQSYVVLELAEKGPVVETGAGKLTLTWPDIAPDDIAELAKRASNPDSGPEMLALGMLYASVGKNYDARLALSAAQRNGAVVSRFLPKVEARLKEVSAKAQEAAAAAAAKEAAAKETAAKEAAAKEAAAKEAAPGTTPAAPAVPGKAAAGADPLTAKGLERRHGIWKVTAEGVMVALPDPADQNPNLMSAKRTIQKNFKSVTVEVRGAGDIAGFSFGDARRFSIAPSLDWQKLTIERGTKIVFKVNGTITESSEAIGKDVTPDNLVLEAALYLRFKGTKGEFRNLVVEE